MDDAQRLARLNARLAAVPESVRKALHPALDKSANEIANAARRNVSDDPATGAPDLKSSIRVEQGRIELARIVRAGGEATTKDGYDYALANEYGTSKMQAQPFMYPAKQALAKRIENRLKREVRKAVRAFWGVQK